jgi:hypothetical protein
MGAALAMNSIDYEMVSSITAAVVLGADGRFLLTHRGQRFTATPSVIPKKIIYQYFSRWLQLVTDDDKAAPVIRVGYVGPHLVTRMAAFADQVAALKRSWDGAQGSLLTSARRRARAINLPAAG